MDDNARGRGGELRRQAGGCGAARPDGSAVACEMEHQCRRRLRGRHILRPHAADGRHLLADSHREPRRQGDGHGGPHGGMAACGAAGQCLRGYGRGGTGRERGADGERDFSFRGGRKTDEVKKKKRFRMVIGRSVNPNSLQDTGTVNTYCYGLCRSKCGRKNDYKYRIPFYQRDYITKVVVYVKQPGSDLYVCNQERNISCYDRTALFEFGLGTQGFNGAVIGVRLDKYVETNGTAEFYVSTKTMPLCIPNVGKRHYFHNGHRRKRSLSDARDVVACNVCSWGKWEKKGEDKLVLTRDVNQNEDFVFTGIVKKLCNVPVRKDGYTFYFHEKYVTVSNVRKIPGCPKNSLRGKYRLYQLRNGEFSRRVDSFISFRVVCRWTYETTYRITIEDIKKERV